MLVFVGFFSTFLLNIKNGFQNYLATVDHLSEKLSDVLNDRKVLSLQMERKVQVSIPKFLIFALFHNYKFFKLKIIKGNLNFSIYSYSYSPIIVKI